ncbi:MAG: hypothetical protein WC516_01900 [Patescibacteria group bacterium]
MIFFRLIELITASPAKRDRLFLTNFIFTLVINIIMWVLLLYRFLLAKEYIITQYNIYFGISSLDPWYHILLLPALGLLVIIINALLAFHFYLKQQLLSRFLFIGMTVFNLVMIAEVLLLIYIN